MRQMPGILVGVDGSDHSRKALGWAAREAALRHVPLTVLTVYQDVTGYWGAAFTYANDETLAAGEAELAAQARKEAQHQADEVLAGLGDSPRPVAVTVRAVRGIPAEELLAEADSGSADLLVVGSRGAGGFRKLLMGSVCSQVTLHARVPVVVIPDENR
jgi:nucleotide-binding universal stress UspA family protein